MKLEKGETTIPIKGYEGIYSISSHGRVWRHGSYRQQGGNSKWKRVGFYRGKWLKLHLNPNGRYNIKLVKDGVRTNNLISRLVAIAFIPNPLDKPEVNHIDGDKTNNKSNNLEWSTRSENQLHAYKNGLVEAHGVAKKKGSIYA